MSKHSFVYDATLKDLFRGIPYNLVKLLTGKNAIACKSIEFSEVKRRSPDLVVTLEDKAILHIELQSGHESNMPARMLEYYGMLLEHLNIIPQQMVLYLGYEKLYMKSGLNHPHLQFQYDLIDIRDLDCKELVASENIGDVILSLLCNQGTELENIQKILRYIARLEDKIRQDALTQLLLLTPLRQVEFTVTEEIKKMPISMDLSEHPFFQEILQKQLKAQEAAFKKQEAENKAETERNLLKKMLINRFQTLPNWVEEKLQQANAEQLEVWFDKALSANSLEEIF